MSIQFENSALATTTTRHFKGVIKTTMLDSQKHAEPSKSSERSFGIVFSVVFLIIALWPLLSGGAPRWVFVALAIGLLLITFIRPAWLSGPNHYWYKFGLLLGAVIAPLVMALVFLITVVPIGLIAKLLGKDMLDQKIDKSASTYWKTRTEPMQSFDKQY